MAKLPIVSGQAAVRAFEKSGWTTSRRHGSHIVLTKAGAEGHLSVPDHRELGRGLLRSLIRDAGLTVEEFVKLLK